MLRDRYRQLLTAYVDGELSSRQRRHVARLLRRSTEARQLLQRLQRDARALRQLSRPHLSADLTGRVLRTIGERRLTPDQRRRAGVSAASWMGPLASWAAAASVLLILGAASYLYFAASLDSPANREVVQLKPESSTPPPHAEQRQPSLDWKEKTSTTASHKKPASKDARPSLVKTTQVAKNGGAKSTPSVSDKPPLPKKETALTERLEMFPLDRVPDILPVILKVSDLEQEVERKNLLAELGKDSDFRMELPCPNGTKAFERVQRAAGTIHLGLIVEKQAQERIKQKWRTSYVLYVENVTPEELIRFVREIGSEDRKMAASKSVEAQIDRLVLTRLTAQQRKELSTLLGIEPLSTTPAATGPLGTDPRKPLADLTAQQLNRALGGQGGVLRPATGKPAAKPPEQFALVLTSNLIRPSPSSEEIKHFLESRKPARSGTIRVLLVLRS